MQKKYKRKKILYRKMSGSNAIHRGKNSNFITLKSVCVCVFVNMAATTTKKKKKKKNTVHSGA